MAPAMASPALDSAFRTEAPRPPTTDAAIRALVSTMTTANPLWGAPRIHGELAKPGITVGPFGPGFVGNVDEKNRRYVRCVSDR
jgi:hypothetical protein